MEVLRRDLRDPALLQERGDHHQVRLRHREAHWGFRRRWTISATWSSGSRRLAGKEHVTPIVLQGHLDMVCEKNKGPCTTSRKTRSAWCGTGTSLMADGTTLGADNGIAVATNLAIMEDSDAEHGPLEFLFTVDEETGLTGANNLGPDFLAEPDPHQPRFGRGGGPLRGLLRRAEHDGDVEARPSRRRPPKSAAGIVRVKGLKGGHSGLEIDKSRGNAIKILGSALLGPGAGSARGWSSLDGGNKHNAIPREAEAAVYAPKKNRWDAAAAIVTGVQRHRPRPNARRWSPTSRSPSKRRKACRRGKVFSQRPAEEGPAGDLGAPPRRHQDERRHPGSRRDLHERRRRAGRRRRRSRS